MSLELPLVIVDVQRGGPSTGLPTKTEQSDLLLAMYGRHGEAPLPIVAARSPSHCFDAAFEAVRIAVKYRTPVILLTDGYLANGAEPWLLPDVDALPDISVPFATEPNHTTTTARDFWPYLRDPETLARPWAIPGTPGLHAPHRRASRSRTAPATSTTTPRTTSTWSDLRAEKIARHRQRHPRASRSTTPSGADAARARLGEHLGRRSSRRCARRAPPGSQVAHAHLVHLNPFPREPRRRARRATDEVLVPEMNLGQLLAAGAGRVPGRRA